MSETLLNYQGLFNLLSNEHGIILLESEMDEVIREAMKIVDLNTIKAEAWQEGHDAHLQYINDSEEYYQRQPMHSEPPEPINPYKEPQEPPTWEAREAWDGGFADNH